MDQKSLLLFDRRESNLLSRCGDLRDASTSLWAPGLPWGKQQKAAITAWNRTLCSALALSAL